MIMSDKKKFKETTVGKLLFGAASMINPTLGKVLSGVSSPQEALAEIGKSKISNEDKIKLQQMIYEQQNKEIEAVTNRWQADSISQIPGLVKMCDHLFWFGVLLFLV